MHRTAVALFLLAAPLAGAAPPSPPVVEYTISVSLDPKAKSLDGTERLVWRNPSSDPVSELRFHLYLNAFKNNRSTFMRESGGQLRGDEAGKKAEDWGWIDVASMKTADGTDLRKTARLIQPDGNDPSDETVFLVPLAAPVPPHGSIALDIAFHAKLPKIFARTGFVRDYFLVGQWFPKIGVYEPAGMRGRKTGGWNCHAFHANSEFYADYGRFDVTMSVPSNFVVGATGKRVSEEKHGDRASYRYVQDDVHDFAWTADPRFVVVDFPFDPAKDVPKEVAAKAAKELGMTEAEIALKPVSCRLLLQPGHEATRERYIRSTKEGIVFYGLWFGAYPYETLTVVDPPDDGGGSGGMEYPTFITTGGPWYGPPGFHAIEYVTIHEFGHQWFYGLLASDEVTWPFLDEGMNTYAEAEGLRAWKGSGNVIDALGLAVDDAELHTAFTGSRVHDQPVASSAFAFPTGSHYGGLVYGRTGSIFETVDRVWGKELGARAIGRYARRVRFRHPTPEDLLASYEEAVGPDCRAMLEEALFRKGWVDFRVEGIHSPRVAPALGIFDRDGKRETVKASDDKSETSEYDGWVLVARQGTLVMPVDVEATLEDGTTQRMHWDGKESWTRLPFHGKSPIAFAVVDPDHAVVVDQDRTNDFMRAGSAPAPSGSRVFERLTYAAQIFFSGVLP